MELQLSLDQVHLYHSGYSLECGTDFYLCALQISVEGQDPNHHNDCPRYDIKQFDVKAPVMVEFGEMQSTPSLPSLQGPLWSAVVAPDKVPIYASNRNT